MRRAILLLIAGVAVAAGLDLQPLDEQAYARLIRSQAGRVVLVNFWATWCGPCREEMPALAAIEARLRDRGLVLLTVSADEPEEKDAASQFLQKSKIRPPVYLKATRDDDRFIRAVAPEWSGALPALFLYDRKGQRVKSYVGESDLKAVEAEVLRLLAGKTPGR